MYTIPKWMSLAMTILIAVSCQPDTAPEQVELSSEETVKYLSKGNKIAAETQKTLGSNLMGAIKEGGVQNALTYCSLNALLLKDSLSKMHHVDIKRKSEKYRNPADKPNEVESKIIATYEKAALAGDLLKPIIKSIGRNQIAYYAPIMLGGLCLKCHGTVGEELTDSNYTFIQKLYPEDLAINYQSGDLRGIWSITFEK